MSRLKNGNARRSSRFICLKCLSWKTTYIQGIQRHSLREKNHIKDNICTNCGEVKTMEVRYCDYLPNVMMKAMEEHNKLYDDNLTEIDVEFYGKISIEK